MQILSYLILYETLKCLHVFSLRPLTTLKDFEVLEQVQRGAAHLVMGLQNRCGVAEGIGAV